MPKLLARSSADARPCSSAGGIRENAKKFARSVWRPLSRTLKSVSVLAALSQICKRHGYPLADVATPKRRRIVRKNAGNPGLFESVAACALHPIGAGIPRPYARFPATARFVSPSSSPRCGSWAGTRCRHGDCWMAWRAEASVDAWIVPIDPVPPAPFDRLLRIKYRANDRHAALVLAAARSRASPRGRCSRLRSLVRVVSPGAAPRRIVARLLGKPVVLNYHSGEAPDHLRRSAIARFVMRRRRATSNVVPVAVSSRCARVRSISTQSVVPNIVDLRQFAYRVARPAAPEAALYAQLRAALQRVVRASCLRDESRRTIRRPR